MVRRYKTLNVAIIASTALMTTTLAAQIPCPVMLVSGTPGQDTITLSFRNKGKLPIETLSLSCKPSLNRGTSTCHTESGVFFPGMQYSINMAYPKADKRQVVISVREAVMNSGARWDSHSSDKCRPLKVSPRGGR